MWREITQIRAFQLFLQAKLLILQVTNNFFSAHLLAGLIPHHSTWTRHFGSRFSLKHYFFVKHIFLYIFHLIKLQTFVWEFCTQMFSFFTVLVTALFLWAVSWFRCFILQYQFQLLVSLSELEICPSSHFLPVKQNLNVFSVSASLSLLPLVPNERQLLGLVPVPLVPTAWVVEAVVLKITLINLHEQNKKNRSEIKYIPLTLPVNLCTNPVIRGTSWFMTCQEV